LGRREIEKTGVITGEFRFYEHFGLKRCTQKNVKNYCTQKD